MKVGGMVGGRRDFGEVLVVFVGRFLEFLFLWLFRGICFLVFFVVGGGCVVLFL